MSDPLATIDEIANGLRFDGQLRRTSYHALRYADENYLKQLLSDVAKVRVALDQHENAFVAKNSEFLEKIQQWNRDQLRSTQKRIWSLVLWLRSETGPVERLVELIRERQAASRHEALQGWRKIGTYIGLAGAIADAASKQLKWRGDWDEKIALATLLVESLIGINHVSEARGEKEFHQILYNCVRACIEVDALQGFDRNIDKFNGVAIAELLRLGPITLEYLERAKVSAEKFATEGNLLEAIDRLLNPADVLTMWAGLTRGDNCKYSPDSIFEECFALYEGALTLAHEGTHRAHLIISRFSQAYFRFARFKYESGGAALKDEVLSIANRAIQLLSRVTSPSGDFYSRDFDLLRMRLRELQFAMLALELDPSIERLKNYIVSSVLELAEKEGERLRTVWPWVALYRIFSEIYDESREGVDLLERFAENTRSPFARERALVTSLRLQGHRSTLIANTEMQAIEDLDWLDSIRTAPESLSALKITLAGYSRMGYGPKGTQGPLALQRNFPEIAYAGLFRRLLNYDDAIRTEGIDRPPDGHAARADVLVSWFRDRFGWLEIAGLEEVSHFLLQRGKARLYHGDISACIVLLQYGLTQSDDAYWYGRLIAAYRQLRELSRAAEVAAMAQQKFPQDSVITVEAALVKIMNGEYADAADDISTFADSIGVGLSSCHPALEGLYAYAMSMSDQDGVAEAAYRRMVAFRPADWRARHGLGCLLFCRGPESYPEAVRHWTSTILLCDPPGDSAQANIARDSLIQIAQAAKEMRSRGGQLGRELVTILRELGDFLPVTSLTALMKAFMVCGGLRDTVLCMMEQVNARGNERLSRAFTQCCMGMLVEDAIKGETSPYAAAIVEFASENGTLGDLFGGAKGAYARNLLRISANPILERKLDVRLQSLKDVRLPVNWQAISDLVSTDGYIQNYYAELYKLLDFSKQVTLGEIGTMLDEITLSTISCFRREMDRKKIILEESFPRSFSVNWEEPISAGLNEGMYNCDPDKLRAVLQHFRSAGPQNMNGTSSWTLFGEIGDEMQHALLEANIRTEILGSGVCVASISGSTPLH